MTLEEEKKNERSRLRNCIRGVDDGTRRSWQAALEENFFNLELIRRKNVFCIYKGIRDEVKTDGIIRKLMDLGKIVTLPLCTDEGLVPYVIDKREACLTIGSYGIPEPNPDVCPVFSDAIEAAVVPGLGFDRSCRRLGRGKGWYDRFFQRNTDAVKIGLAYEIQVAESIPAGPDDAVMDCVVTEKGFYGNPQFSIQ